MTIALGQARASSYARVAARVVGVPHLRTLEVGTGFVAQGAPPSLRGPWGFLFLSPCGKHRMGDACWGCRAEKARCDNAAFSA